MRTRVRTTGWWLIGALVIGMGCGSDPMIAPGQLVPFEAPDKAFAGQGPQNWKQTASAGMGVMSGVTFRSGPAMIDIFSDLQGSLMGDIAKAGNAQMENMAGMMPGGGGMSAAPKPPVERLHQRNRGKASKNLEDYQEQPAKSLTSSLGEARYSEFTATEKALPSSVAQHGFRVTILGGERQITIVCRCPESDWASAKPTFQNVITSLKQGSN